MNDESSTEKTVSEDAESLDRRLFLRSLGKWSGAAVIAAIAGGFWLASSPETKAGLWINRRGPWRGGGWINRGGGWINGGGGGWINRRGPWRGGGWINRW
ncbi:MAG: hypothetical protein WCC08_23220 [Terrimicrobiaceae bacterium]